MKTELISRLRCPQSGQALSLASGNAATGEIESGELVSEDGQHRYPIRKGIPRFVPVTNYADNFGMQWNHFAKTQLDSYSGLAISAERFWNATGWKPEDLRDRWVLDVGCGSGRFAEIALTAGAKVVALDYSNAVDACYANLKQHPGLHVAQGDVYALPFSPESFDYVYSLGVLQHTPDVARAFAALPSMLTPGGKLCTDFYWNRIRTLLNPKYLLRPVTKKMNQDRLFRILQRTVPGMLKVSGLIGRLPYGNYLKRIIPVADDSGHYPFSQQQLQEWALLDTFDMLAPAYDNPQSVATVQKWFAMAGLENIEVLHSGHLVGRGIKRKI